MEGSKGWAKGSPQIRSVGDASSDIQSPGKRSSACGPGVVVAATVLYLYTHT